MGALEQNTTLIYGVHIRESANDGSDFSNGATDYRVLFLGEDGQLHVKDSAGTVTDIGGGSPGIPATLFDAAGDLIVASAADTAARKAAGADWTRLQARAGATNGIEWAGGIGCLAYNNTTQATGGVDVALTFNSEEFDTHAFHDTSSNTSRVTIPTGMGGKYIIAGGSFSAASIAVYFRLNGTTKVRGARSRVGAGYHNLSMIQNLAAADYVELIGAANATFGDASDPNAMNTLSVLFLGP